MFPSTKKLFEKNTLSLEKEGETKIAVLALM